MTEEVEHIRTPQQRGSAPVLLSPHTPGSHAQPSHPAWQSTSKVMDPELTCPFPPSPFLWLYSRAPLSLLQRPWRSALPSLAFPHLPLAGVKAAFGHCCSPTEEPHEPGKSCEEQRNHGAF